MGIPIFVEVGNAAGKSSSLKDALLIAFGVFLSALLTYGNSYVVNFRQDRKNLKTFTKELYDLEAWCDKSIKKYAQCMRSLTGPPAEESLVNAKGRDVSYVPSFYWASTAEPSKIIGSFKDDVKRLGVRNTFFWLEKSFSNNKKVRSLVHDDEVFLSATRSKAENTYELTLHSLVMLKVHISMFKADRFSSYSMFEEKNNKEGFAFKQVSEELNINLPEYL